MSLRLHGVLCFALLSACSAGEDAPTRAREALKEERQSELGLALGRAHGCSLDPAISGVLCWGDDSRGQTRVPLLLGPTAIAAGGDVTCAVAGGRVRCWGDASRGQLAVPRDLRNPKSIAVGEAHACAVTREGGVRCWGEAENPEVQGAVAVAAGAHHSCALLDREVTCWGDDSAGQLAVPTLEQPSALVAGGDHTCVLDGDAVVCWGGAIAGRVPVLDQPSSIAAGAAGVCALDSVGVHCWGEDGAQDLTPRELTLPYALAVGGAHACARHLQGVACWGDDALGRTRYDGAPLHLLYRSEAEIDAPAERIWDVLVDLEGYPAWNPYTVAMRSTLEVGEPMIMSVKMSPLLTIEQTEHIRLIEPGHKICWGIETETPELNSGERCQWLEPLPDGRTRYVTEDLIEGSLNPTVTLLFGDAVRDGFEAVATALKEHVESMP
ncbi:MAG: SRPBCC family protein [Polyangiales bacterium]